MVGEESQWFFSQVTPFHLHVKIGHYNTLAWVTAFDTGLPLCDVHVQLTTRATGYPAGATHGSRGGRHECRWSGCARLYKYPPSCAATAADLGESRQAACLCAVAERRRAGYGAPGARFQVHAYGPNRTHIRTSLERRYGHIRTWGTTPQGVYRAGDTVQYKLYVRDQDNQRFIPAPRTDIACRFSILQTKWCTWCKR